MATDHDDSFHGFGSRPAGTITTITSDNNHKRVPNRHSLLPFRHVSSSSEEDGGSATSSIHSSSHHRHSRRFQHGLKLLDLTAKTRGGGGNNGGEVPRRDHVRSQASQGSGSGTEAAAASPSGSATSFPAMTKEEFEALPPTIRRKVSSFFLFFFFFTAGMRVLLCLDFIPFLRRQERWRQDVCFFLVCSTLLSPVARKQQSVGDKWEKGQR